MKTYLYLFILLGFTACKPKQDNVTQKAEFGIYETITINEVPLNILNKVDTSKIILEKKLDQPILGYILKSDEADISKLFINQDILLLRTVNTVDPDKKYQALVLLHSIPQISIEDINKTKNMGNIVEIRFNMNGARKWAETIQNNIGKMVAFTIDKKIYTLPLVNDRIDNGRALINGIDTEETAKKVSDLLNSSIQN